VLDGAGSNEIGPTGYLSGAYFLIFTGPDRMVFDDGDTFTEVAGRKWIIPS
jgi:hypothetical protein